jgi:endonuclease YncB( thermonuclease family)
MRFLLVLLFFAFSPAGAEPPRAWEQWDDCRLVADRFFDGDSFQVQHGKSISVLRLYSADAPETDDGYGTRISEQAAYFGVTNAEVLRGGAVAKEFAAKFLATPFRVITRRKTAPGASRAERFYAIIERDGVRLDAALIQAGLARATTEAADFPDAPAGHTRLTELRALEQKAAFDRKGLWATSQRQDRRQTLLEKLSPRRLLQPGTLPAARKVKLNSAPASDLEALPGIGPKTAEAIARARPIRDFPALDAVPGLGPKKIEALRDLVSFE